MLAINKSHLRSHSKLEYLLTQVAETSQWERSSEGLE